MRPETTRRPPARHAGLAGLALACTSLATALACAGRPPPAPKRASATSMDREVAVFAPSLRPDPVEVPPPPPEPPPTLDPVTEPGQRARGIYLTGPFLRRFGVVGALRALETARADAAVIDLKDGQGRVTYATAIDDLQAQRAVFLDDPAELVRRLKHAGIYTIARVVCFSDPVLPHRQPERAILDGRPRRQGRVWTSWGTGGSWLDPTLSINHDLVLALVEEAESFGFDEIQLDYIRFPVDRAAHHAVLRGFEGRSRVQVMTDLLSRLDAALGVPLSVDVFGLTAFREGDPSSLGQDLEAWVPHVEVFSPMLYLNAMKTWGRHLDRRALGLIKAGVSRLRERVGPVPVIRPFLQAFDDGVSDFSARTVREQIRGARVGGADGWLFWHPASNYGRVFTAMRARSAERLLRRVPMRSRIAARQAAWAWTP